MQSQELMQYLEISRMYIRFLVFKSEKKERKCLGNVGQNQHRFTKLYIRKIK